MALLCISSSLGKYSSVRVGGYSVIMQDRIKVKIKLVAPGPTWTMHMSIASHFPYKVHVHCFMVENT
jgi:hypothetical protein